MTSSTAAAATVYCCAVSESVKNKKILLQRLLMMSLTATAGALGRGLRPGSCVRSTMRSIPAGCGAHRASALTGPPRHVRHCRGAPGRATAAVTEAAEFLRRRKRAMLATTRQAPLPAACAHAAPTGILQARGHGICGRNLAVATGVCATRIMRGPDRRERRHARVGAIHADASCRQSGRRVPQGHCEGFGVPAHAGHCRLAQDRPGASSRPYRPGSSCCFTGPRTVPAPCESFHR